VNYSQSAEEAQLVANEICSLGRRSIAISANVQRFDEVEVMTKRVISEFGQIDVLINNAGILRRSLIMMMDAGEFENVLKTNVLGTFNCMKSVSRHMIKARRGVIVNISSLAGQRGFLDKALIQHQRGALIA